MVKWPFQRSSDLRLGDQKVTLNRLEEQVLVPLSKFTTFVRLIFHRLKLIFQIRSRVVLAFDPLIIRPASTGFLQNYCWWFRNPANQLRLAVYPTIYSRFIHSRWLAVGLLNHHPVALNHPQFSKVWVSLTVLWLVNLGHSPPTYPRNKDLWSGFLKTPLLFFFNKANHSSFIHHG